MNHTFSLATCPRCQNEVDPRRLSESVIVCNHCGYVSEAREEQLELACEKSIIKYMAVIAVVLALGFSHAGNWGAHAFSIIPLTVKQVLGAATPQDFIQLEKICIDQSRPDCVEEALAGRVTTEPGNIENLARLAQFQARMNNWDAAAQNFSTYFTRGGASGEAAYHYARTLEKMGRVDDAVRMYDFALLTKPDVLQITVTQSYVHLLMNNRRYSEARKLIESIRKSGANAKYFMAKEYDQLK